ncbi:MAG: IS66 family transposase ISPto8 [bacterium]|nr:IS66 family transposase ISPto8 [bacterium]
MIATAPEPTYNELQFEVLRLRQENAELRRLLFGQKRERFIPVANDQQLEIALNDDRQQAAPVATTTITYARREKKASPAKFPSRNFFPDHLRREIIRLEPEGDISGLKKIGDETTQELEYVPPELYVKVYIRPKYAAPKGEGVVIADLPSRPIDKGIPGPGLLAQVAVNKFVDHLPLYRQHQQFLRMGVSLPYSTLADWIKAMGMLLAPLAQATCRLVQQSSYLMVDETPIPVLTRVPLASGKCHLGYYWVYYDPLAKVVFFDYRPGRSRAGPNEILQNFNGHLQIDGYEGYNNVIARPRVIAVGCFAHARRYFDKAKDSDRGRAEWMLSKIQALYLIERRAREEGLPFEARYQLRQREAVPLLAEIKAWLKENSIQVLPKSAMGKAIGYMLGQWSKLEQYVTDGRLEIDNNLVENAIRPVAIGRRNYLFAGSHDGARRAAVIYTLLATAKLHQVEPFAYLRDILNRLPDHPINKIAELLPQNWRTPNS